MKLEKFNLELKKVYPTLLVKLDNCGICNMFSNNGITEEYQELNLYRDNKKVKCLCSATFIDDIFLGKFLDNHYKKYIEPKIQK